MQGSEGGAVRNGRGATQEVELSIVIVTRNAFDVVHACLTSIQRSTRNIEYEIIVVDNGSTDGSATRIRETFPDIILISNASNDGYGAACNLGVANSRGTYLAILNDDIECRENAFGRLVQLLNERGNVGAVAPRLISADGRLQHTTYRFPSLASIVIRETVPRSILETGGLHWAIRRLALVFKKDLGGLVAKVDSGEVRGVQGSAFLIRRSVYERIGGFDSDRFFLFAEEGDLFYRLHKANWKVYYLAEATLVHYGGKTVSGFKHRYEIQKYKSFLNFFEKHYGWSKTTQFRIIMALIFLPKSVGYYVSSFVFLRRRTQLLQAAEMYFVNLRMLFDKELRKQNVIKNITFRHITPPHS